MDVGGDDTGRGPAGFPSLQNREDMRELPSGQPDPAAAGRSDMGSAGSTLRVLGQELGGLILFWIVLWRFGLKPAIAAALLFVLIDGARRLIGGIGFPKVWILSNGLALAFGLIDLRAATPFMIRYEAVVTNLITGVVFLVGAFGRKPMIQEIAEERQGGPFEDGLDLRPFFKAFTLVWAGYFFVKALAYVWLVRSMPLEHALAVRSIAGTASFVVMLLISFQGRRIYALSRRWKLLPAS